MKRPGDNGYACIDGMHRTTAMKRNFDKGVCDGKVFAIVYKESTPNDVIVGLATGTYVCMYACLHVCMFVCGAGWNPYFNKKNNVIFFIKIWISWFLDKFLDFFVFFDLFFGFFQETQNISRFET